MGNNNFYQTSFSFSQNDIIKFAELTGDKNPIHLDEEVAKNTIFGKRILHGFLGASIFSKVFGTIFPGEGTIYIKQNLIFLKPMFPDEIYTACFEIKEIIKEKSRAIIHTFIKNESGEIVIDGEAIIQNKIYSK
ncbi:MAG TPA: MaoC family dehydratase [Bacteroidales bacterium]|nr:MaoC family dehydratase [Bacteroidales bacterium]